jgi:hypothetical protein
MWGSRFWKPDLHQRLTDEEWRIELQLRDVLRG